MKYPKKPFKQVATRVITYGSLAAFLTVAPPVYDSDSGWLSYPPAHAKSCFIAGTRILMADGSWLAIEGVRPGDRVVGKDGRINRVTEVEQVQLGDRRLYGFNGHRPFVTAEHPFMTPQGWKSIDPAMTAAETPRLRVDSLGLGDDLLRVTHYHPGDALTDGNLALRSEAELELATERLDRIESVEADPETPLFNLLLDGNHSYIADDYLVHNKGGDGGSGDSGGGDDSGGDSGGDGSGGDDDSSGPGGDDDGDDSSDSGSGNDNDGDENSGGDDSGDRADDSGGRDDDSRGRGRGRGSHGFDDDPNGPEDSFGESDNSFEGPDDSDGRSGRGRSHGADEVSGLADDRDNSRREERADRVRTEKRIGLETAPDFQRNRTEQRFDAQGNLTRQRTEQRVGPDTAAGFQRSRTEQRFDGQGNLTRDRSSVQVGPDDDNRSVSLDDSRDRSLREDAVTPSGPDLTPEEEAAAISSGWQ